MTRPKDPKPDNKCGPKTGTAPTPTTSPAREKDWKGPGKQ